MAVELFSQRKWFFGEGKRPLTLTLQINFNSMKNGQARFIRPETLLGKTTYRFRGAMGVYGLTHCDRRSSGLSTNFEIQFFIDKIDEID